MRWAVHVASMEKRISEYRVLVERPERQRQLGRPRSRWEDNFKIYFEGLGWRNRLNRSGSRKGKIGAFVNVAMNLRFA